MVIEIIVKAIEDSDSRLNKTAVARFTGLHGLSHRVPRADTWGFMPSPVSRAKIEVVFIVSDFLSLTLRAKIRRASGLL